MLALILETRLQRSYSEAQMLARASLLAAAVRMIIGLRRLCILFILIGTATATFAFSILQLVEIALALQWNALISEPNFWMNLALLFISGSCLTWWMRETFWIRYFKLDSLIRSTLKQNK